MTGFYIQKGNGQLRLADILLPRLSQTSVFGKMYFDTVSAHHKRVGRSVEDAMVILTNFETVHNAMLLWGDTVIAEKQHLKQRFPNWWVASRFVLGREKFLRCDFYNFYKN
jgi:hypothetical protein